MPAPRRPAVTHRAAPLLEEERDILLHTLHLTEFMYSIELTLLVANDCALRVVDARRPRIGGELSFIPLV